MPASWFTSVAAAKAPRECLSSSEIKEVDSTRIMFLILWRSKTWMPNPSAKLFQVVPPVPYAVRVNDASERRPFLKFLGRSTHRRRDFGPRQDQFLPKKMSRRGAIR